MYRNYNDLNFITALRAVAILLVFLIHSGGLGLREINPTLNMFVDWGKYGVMIFFVISGFTIYNQIISKNMNFKNFILVRFFRLISPYWPILLFLLMFPNIYSCSWGIEYPASLPIINWLLHFGLINFFDLQYANTIIGVEWTLSIEFFYYIIFGLLLSSIFYKKKLFRNSVIFFIFAYFLTKIVKKLFTIDPLLIHWSPIPYAFMFVLGGLAFIIRKKYEVKYSEITLQKISNTVGIGIILLLISNLYCLFISDIEKLFALSTFILLIFIRDNSLFGYLLRNPIFMFIGSISYSFYLIHMIILNINVEFNVIYKFLIILGISFIWYYLFENLLYSKIKLKVLKND